MSTETFEALIERKYRALLDDPETKGTALTSALSGAVKFLATRNPQPPEGGAPGSALREDVNDGQD